MFDNSVVLFGSGIKHGDYHSVADLPLVLSGGGGGTIKLGRYVRYRHAPNGNLHLKLMQIMGVERKRFGNSTAPLRGITETGSFDPQPSDDGSWQVVKSTGKQIIVKGLLQVRVTTDDPNLYLVQLSDGSAVEIRTDFGNINSNRMDLNVGSVVTMTGRLKITNNKRIITKVLGYKVER